MSTTVVAFFVVLITTGMTSAFNHQFTLIGGCVGALIYAGCAILSRNARVYPTMFAGAIAMSTIVLISSEVNVAEFSSTIHILCCYLALVALGTSSTDLSGFSRQVIMGNNLLLTAWILYQAKEADTLKAWAISNPSGAGNLMAAQVNMTLPLVLVRIHESRGLVSLAYRVLLCLNCVAVFFVMSRNGIGSMLILLTLYVLFNHKRLAIFVIGSILCVSVALDSIIQIPFIHDLLVKLRIVGFKPVAPRSLIWQISFDHIVSHPWLGVGPGRPQKLLAVVDICHAHNNFVQVALESGLVAASIFTVLIGMLLWMPCSAVLRKREHFVHTLPIIAYFIFSWTAGPLVFPGATFLLAVCVNEARGAIQKKEELTAEQLSLSRMPPARVQRRPFAAQF